MKLAKYRGANGKDSIGLVEGERILPLESSGNQYQTLSDLFEADDRAGALSFMINRSVESLPLSSVQLLPPVDRQEVWAAGVTYRRSKTARMEESATAASVYDMVYEAARPELFFKATAARPLSARRSRCGFAATANGTCPSRSWPWCSIRGWNWSAIRSATT